MTRDNPKRYFAGNTKIAGYGEYQNITRHKINAQNRNMGAYILYNQRSEVILPGES